MGAGGFVGGGGGGSSQGIGRAIALEFARGGQRVVAADIDPEAGEVLMAQAEADGLQLKFLCTSIPLFL